MRYLQHKKEAFWFYRFLSRIYDEWVNPFFWNEPMREEALDLGYFDNPELTVIDVGAGTGFTTEGIVQRVKPENVVMVDQNPYQLEKALKKKSLDKVKKKIGDAEDLPFPDDSFDRYVSAGSIEYWPEPQRGICEAYRVIKPGGFALLIGPIITSNAFTRAISNIFMLFPTVQDYLTWYKRAGFVDIKIKFIAPEWYEGKGYGIAIVGRKPKPGKSPLELGPKKEDVKEPFSLKRFLVFVPRFLMGSLAGGVFVPLAGLLTLNARKKKYQYMAKKRKMRQ